LRVNYTKWGVGGATYCVVLLIIPLSLVLFSFPLSHQKVLAACDMAARSGAEGWAQVVVVARVVVTGSGCDRKRRQEGAEAAPTGSSFDMERRQQGAVATGRGGNREQ